MKKETKKAPAIRFQGFTDDWEQRKLGDFVEFFSGLTYTPKDVQKNGTLVLRSSNVNNGEIIDADNVYVNPQVVNSDNVKIGDIIVVVRNGSRSLIGKHAKVKNFMPNTVIGAFMTGIRSKYPEFTNALLSTSKFRREVTRNMGATINQITGYMFSKMEFEVPSLNEQKNIGEYFRTLDFLITLHQRKLDQLKTLKKYFLQNMFPAKGEKVPRIRFKGFTGDWEQHKVIDLLNLLTDFDANGSFADMAKNVNTFDGSGFAWYVRMTDLENPKPLDKLKYVDKLSYDFLRKTHLYGGELLMAKRGNIGEIYIFEPRTEYATVAPNMYLLKLNEMVIPRFLYTFFISDEGQRQLIRLNASTTMGALYKDDVKNINVIMPKIGEQEKIAEHFSNLEYIITLHQRKLEQLQTMKKFMLQNMFI